ncbi:putative NRPS-like enzyme [Xylariomycetidae sp. FL2044]|nr:putative NRPS-like enzyme [Xylariomycetidae sp. FL2044]
MATEHAIAARWQNDLLPHIVDRLARERADAPYASWPVLPTSYDGGYRTVTYAQLANVVNGLAWSLVRQLGPGGGSEVLTYVGPNDVRYMALVLAANKAGYVLFLTSPRNSPAAHKSLFGALDCQTLVTSDPAPPAASAIIEAVKPRCIAIPSVQELMGKQHAHFAYEKTFEQARSDPFAVLHTSGSTGIPKPIMWTLDTVAKHHNLSGLAPPEGVSSQASLDYFFHGKRILSTLPPFHGAGLCQYLYHAVPFGNTVIAPATAAIPTAQGVVDALKATPADVALLVPSVVAELAQNPELLEYCAAHLELIIYIGGDLPQTIGDRVAAKMKLRCQWGASEVGIPHQMMPPELGPQDWRYIRFHPAAGAVFDQVADGIYELVFRRRSELADTQPPFTVRGQQHLEEYRTRDLFEKHATVPDAWCWRARADDIIVFLNGEKTNPVSMEQDIVASNPELGGAVVVGAQRFQAALLVEPASNTGQLSTHEQAALIERIWSSVQKANQSAPAHARIEKSLILVTSADRPLIRAGKGTIQKAASLAQYAAEIDKLYADADVVLDDDDDEDATNDAPKTLTNSDTIRRVIRETLQHVAGWSDADDETSLFDRGLDSLQALQMTRALRRALQRQDLALSTIYRNPTVAQLTAALTSQQKDDGHDDAAMIEPLFATYSSLIKQIPVPTPASPTPNPPSPLNVILTGSTGSLGTYILQSLLDRPGIGHVFCLNRAADGGRKAQIARFAAAGLLSAAHTLLDNNSDDDDDEEEKKRVTFLHADLAQPSLGLDQTTYDTLRARAGLIVHNAWPVNFNLGLAAFRPHIAGLVNLFGLAAAAAAAAAEGPGTMMKVMFVSSVAAASGLAPAAGPAPEAVLDLKRDAPRAAATAAAANGYAQSKFLAEMLCDVAARHLGVPVAVLRVGQVAGSVGDRRQQGGGMIWNRSEWFPSLVVSSLKKLGCLPDSLGPQFSSVDWVPVDVLAEVIVDLAQGTRTRGFEEEGGGGGAEVLNLRNPKIASWESLIPAVTETAREVLGRGIEVVPAGTWLARLQGSMEEEEATEDMTAAEVRANPALKLLDFYRDSLWADTAAREPMAVQRALSSSARLGELQPVGLDWMRKWVGEWIESHPTTALYLPAVDHLKLSIDNGYDCAWPAQHPPRPTSIRSLDVSGIREGDLGHLLSVVMGLQTLRRQWLYDEFADYQMNRHMFDFDLVQADLSHYFHLYSLPTRLRDVLRYNMPRGLENLTITDDLADHNGCSRVDVALFDAIRVWIEDRTTCTPRLKEFCLVVLDDPHDWGEDLLQRLEEIFLRTEISLEVVRHEWNYSPLD